MKKILAIGELLIDFVPEQKGCALKDVTRFARVAGGAPANVARAVSRLGGASGMVSQVGEDAFGTYILEHLAADGVDTAHVFRTSRANTALAFVSLDPAGNREFSFYRNPSADLFLSPDQITPAMLHGVGALHFGSVDLVDWPVKQAHRNLLGLARDRGLLVSFDPNVRLPLWDCPAHCRDAIREFLPLADLVKLSDDEVSFVTGCTDERQAVRWLLEQGCAMVLITKGPRGASVYTARAHAHGAAQPVAVADTTGAGDSFMGAFLYQLLRADASRETLEHMDMSNMESCLAFAARSAAFTCAHVGAVMPCISALGTAPAAGRP